MKCGSHDEVILELVPCALLDGSQNESPLELPEQYSTLSLEAVFGSITLRMSRTSWAIEWPTWPCLMTNDFGTPGVPFDVLASAEPLLCVRFFLRFAIAKKGG